ncbi:MAG: hypothetical protein AAGG56_12875 [Pseudomonadota bacterium]
MDDLPAVLLALQLALRGDDGLDELTFGRVLEAEVQAFDTGAEVAQRPAQRPVKIDVTREALQIVEDHGVVGVGLGLQITQKRHHPRPFHEIAATGNIVREDRVDPIAPAPGVVAAAGLLALQSVTVVCLRGARHSTIDDSLFALPWAIRYLFCAHGVSLLFLSLG